MRLAGLGCLLFEPAWVPKVLMMQTPPTGALPAAMDGNMCVRCAFAHITLAQRHMRTLWRVCLTSLRWSAPVIYLTTLIRSSCATCEQFEADSTQLATCSRCALARHIYCLNPPLARMPRQSRGYVWLCGACQL